MKGLRPVLATLAHPISTMRDEIRRTWRTYSGTRLITCPETGEAAAVRVAALRGALTVPFGQPLRLRSCSRWPERAGCDQRCIEQVTSASNETRISSLLAAWYQGRTCFYCRHPFTRPVMFDRPAASLTPLGRTVLWQDVQPENISAALKTHIPVCWDCHIAETFRRQHPELVTDRPWPVGHGPRL